MKLQTSYWPGLGSSEGLAGAGKPISKLGHSHDLQAGPGCGWEASVPPCEYLPAALLKCPHGMSADFPQSNQKVQGWKSECLL